MSIRGERFHVDFSDSDDDYDHDHPSISSPSLGFIGDIQERALAAAPKPPAPPQLSSASTGFPQPKRRSRVSAFKKQRAGQDSSPNKPAPNTSSKQEVDNAAFPVLDEKKAIDEENRQRLASMSSAEIEAERGELMSALPQSLIERLLRRANIDEDHQNEDMRRGIDRDNRTKDTEKEPEKQPEKEPTQPKKAAKTVSFDLPSEPAEKQPEEPECPAQPSSTEDLPPSQPPSELYPVTDFPPGHIHFPKPPPRQSPMPNLDPTSPSFFEDLQTHYFPDVPHDPSSLSWLKPSDDPSSDVHTDSTSPYHPDSAATSVSPASLRFSLAGNLLAPRTSLSIPTTLGLHHHADDPEAAGYTIPELAILSRSSLPAQRCLAWQILGRILFRLGNGEFGERGSALVEGLWSVVEREGVVAGMLAEAGGGSGDNKSGSGGGPNAGRIGRHASAKAWATEAVWLWRRGGGGDRGLTKEGVLRSK
ncbi:hypothetical protein AJ79_05199 [Helicocarpus griseus UAMH5409]|uniref:Transcription factor Rba50 n=1 Tax=Helicocarpus griseus UAMH5409 TaxID=1447875 RepID=A0A2B7XQB7_9EURO|nr:hypothetical protein AJ79_05199 [Helicocarpus griseus UAMH5409]